MVDAKLKKENLRFKKFWINMNKYSKLLKKDESTKMILSQWGEERYKGIYV